MGMIERATRAVSSMFESLEGSISNQLLQGVFKDDPLGARPKRNASQFLQAYNTHPWLRAAEHKIGDHVASLNWRVFARRSGNSRSRKGSLLTMENAIEGGGRWVLPVGVRHGDLETRANWRREVKAAGELVEIPDHLALQSLEFSNPYFSGRLTRYLITLYIDILGEAPLIKERNGANKPIGLWPVPPHWVHHMATVQDPFFKIAFGDFGELTSVPEADVLWMVDPDPWNPYKRGSGAVYALADELDTGEAISKYKRAFFHNSARPDFIVEMDGISRRELRRQTIGWNAQHRGFWRAFKAHFINRAIKIHEIGTTNLRELDVSQLAHDERDFFAQAIGIPPEKLGIIENSNKSTSQAADITMAKDVVVPRAEFQRDYFQHRLMPEYDERLVIDYDSPVPEDKEAKLTAMAAKPETVLIDEWREAQGLDMVEDGSGQRFIVPTIGVRTIESFEELEDVPVPSADPFAEDPEDPEDPPEPEPQGDGDGGDDDSDDDDSGDDDSED